MSKWPGTGKGLALAEKRQFNTTVGWGGAKPRDDQQLNVSEATANAVRPHEPIC